jgi:hypothetical protein
LFDEDKKTYGQTISEELYNDEKKEQLLKENKLQEIKKDYNKIKNHKNEFIS